MTTERPILFSSEMVRALLAGTKTQTRRLVTKSTSVVGSSTWEALDWTMLIRLTPKAPSPGT